MVRRRRKTKEKHGEGLKEVEEEEVADGRLPDEPEPDRPMRGWLTAGDFVVLWAASRKTPYLYHKTAIQPDTIDVVVEQWSSPDKPNSYELICCGGKISYTVENERSFQEFMDFLHPGDFEDSDRC